MNLDLSVPPMVISPLLIAGSNEIPMVFSQTRPFANALSRNVGIVPPLDVVSSVKPVGPSL